jgi:SAM-dependent methyltransferase
MKDFYEQHYGVMVHDARTHLAISMLAPLLKQRPMRPLRMLDIGCGDMSSISRIVAGLQAAGLGQENAFQLHGWDCSRAAVAAAGRKGLHAEVRDITAPEENPPDAASYDVIFFLEVLEHLVDTDAAMKNIHALLKPDGLLVLSTPNLAAWYNRLLLFMGFQPHCTEVSEAPYRFGCQFVGRCLGEKPGVTEVAAGHLRVFTWRALREFLDYHAFDILAARGVANHRNDLLGRLLCRLSTSLSGDIILVARLKANPAHLSPNAVA